MTPPAETEGPPDYWKDIFPFDPYKDQVTGINEVVETLGDGGIHLLEGPCGTGKTLIGLTAALSLVRDSNTPFSRILVITSKKQQLSAFEDDLKAINKHSPNYFRGLTLIGKSELCPYVQAGKIDSQEIYHKCINLRDNTHKLMKKAVEDKRASREANAAFGLEVTGQSDPTRERTLSFNGVDAPVKPSIPDIQGTEFCPFYASHITNAVEEKYPQGIRDVTTGEEILENSSKAGTCPHLEMRRLQEKATVLFGNYKHSFDPKTVAGLTSELLNDSTLLICDEAHGLVKEVRNQLSYNIRFSSIGNAANNIREVRQWLNGSGHPEKQELAKSIIHDTDLTKTDFSTSVKFLNKIRSLIAGEIAYTMENEYGSEWKQYCLNQPKDTHEIPLQPPSSQEADTLTTWTSENGYEKIWEIFLKTARLVSVIKKTTAQKVDGNSPDGSFPISNVYELLERWWVGNHSEYFREIKLHKRHTTTTNPPENKPWRAGYYADIHINNSIPQNEIAATLDAFGGALLMSATLSPLDVYEEVTGIKKLRQGAQPKKSLVTKARDRAAAMAEEEEESSERNEAPKPPDLDDIGNTTTPDHDTRQPRNVSKSVFELDFPPGNRASFVVDAPKFTWGDRWPPEENPELRNIYEQAITTVVNTTPGNVLITMPSYQEANWASKILGKNPQVEKDILTDTSSSDAETEQLKQAFFTGPPKVLTTSLRGTLTEGVDFDGDKLNGVVVCGVPITQTSTPLANAIETAYDYRFDNNGFEYAFTVPAVRKTRQAIGRVIRGNSDVGVRVLIDKRYAHSGTFGSVREFFPPQSQDEFTPLDINQLRPRLESFWGEHSKV